MIKEDSNVFAIALWSSKHSWTVSCSGTFSQWGARLCWPHRSMNSFSADWGLGLEENVQLLPTFLIRRSRWSGPGSETGRHRSHHDRWLISAQEDTHLTPLTTHTCRHTATHSDMLDGHRQILSSLPHCVYTSKDHNHTHTHTPCSQTEEMHPDYCWSEGGFWDWCQYYWKLLTVNVLLQYSQHWNLKMTWIYKNKCH